MQTTTPSTAKLVHLATLDTYLGLVTSGSWAYSASEERWSLNMISLAIQQHLSA